MESFRLSSKGFTKKKTSQNPALNIKPTKTSQLRTGASLPQLNASASVHKFPAPRKQACLARIKSMDDQHVEKGPQKKLVRQRSKSHDPETGRVYIRSRGRLPTLGGHYSSQNIFNGNSILWKHQLPVLMSLFLHEEFDVIEVVTFDLLRNEELERLYVVASRIFSIVENHQEVQALFSHKIAKSEAISNARINCTIDFLMSHLGSEKIGFMPIVPTLRRYNEKMQRREPLTVPKPLWLVAGQPDSVCQIIGVLLAKKCIQQAKNLSTVKLRWRWAIKKVIGMNRAKQNIIYAWRRATTSSKLLSNMKRGTSMDGLSNNDNGGGYDDDSETDGSYLTDDGNDEGRLMELRDDNDD